jgi:hypothetical protein
MKVNSDLSGITFMAEFWHPRLRQDDQLTLVMLDFVISADPYLIVAQTN